MNLIESSNDQSNIRTDVYDVPHRICTQKKINCNLLLTNARSLSPKIDSLLDYIDELDITVAVISESWLKPGYRLDQEIDDLRRGENLDVFHHSRKPKKSGRPGAVESL